MQQLLSLGSATVRLLGLHLLLQLLLIVFMHVAPLVLWSADSSMLPLLLGLR